jgi:hypothetical protein
MKFDVRDTFDTFWKEPLSILTKGLFSLVNVQSNIFAEKSVNIDFADGKTQITVVNNEKMFNLFQSVMNRRGATLDKN